MDNGRWTMDKGQVTFLSAAKGSSVNRMRVKGSEDLSQIPFPRCGEVVSIGYLTPISSQVARGNGPDPLGSRYFCHSLVSIDQERKKVPIKQRHLGQ